ncbi:amino acid adenylation domain-containing protein [Polaribacter uvawellassae]|uniref:amino acid adenylation domain-containing protein n=1 Tax=Polaribacter uvawellassae TaxID=3133495 RepID=UPI003219DB1B
MEINYQYNLGQLFDRVATKNPDNIAVKSIDFDNTTFQELNNLSNKIANFLISNHIKRNDVVALLNDKSATSYSIMLACLKIGAIYTNLDAKSPLERFNKMITVCTPKILFYYKDDTSVINDFENINIKTTDYSLCSFSNLLNDFSETLPKENSAVCSNTPAYIMFTSGSTGFPKGVVISHQNVINFIKWAKETYQIKKNDVFTNLNPMHFDNSVFDFYASIFNAASIVPVSEKLTRNPRKLLDELNSVQPTIWFSVPSMLVYVLNMRALKETDLPTLRIVTFGGEGFPKNQLRKLWKFWGDKVCFINVYGPTECTCICSSYIVNEKDLISDDLLPLGFLAPNFQGLIIDDSGNEVKEGEIGELYIGGSNVGIGYFNELEKTSQVFVKNATINTHQEIVYKSGDLVKLDLETKMFLFAGRKDNQIKRMGYRIELEEIENALNIIDAIKESAVLYIDNDKHKSKIIACLTSSFENDTEISMHLKKYLPSYMLPDLFFYYDSLPKNQNGKIDRLKLKKDLT